jgi:hypothetical protein
LFSRENLAGCTENATARTPLQRLSPMLKLPVALAETDNVLMYLEVTSSDAEALHGWIKGYRDLYEKFQDSQLEDCTALLGHTGDNTTH